MANSQSTITLQQILDKVLPLGDIRPILNEVSGYQLEPFITICTDVMTDIYGQSFPYKWNEIKLPLFVTNSWQQDYVLLNPDGSSFTNLEWLERGIAINLSSASTPKQWTYVECGRQLGQATGAYINPWFMNPLFEVNWFPNSTLYYGTWGAADSGNATQGNNPGPNSVYTNPTTATISPANPITQIIDTNGNIQVVTTYGTCGATQPSWPAAGSPPGTTTNDGTTVWTVADPNGIGIRVLPVPPRTGVVWQFNLIGQQPAPNFSKGSGGLSQTLAPFPDKYEPYFRAGVIAQCYRYSTMASVQAKFEKNYQLWLKSLNDLRVTQDRELEENQFTPERGIMSSGRSKNRYVGAAWPFNYPQ